MLKITEGVRDVERREPTAGRRSGGSRARRDAGPAHRDASSPRRDPAPGRRNGQRPRGDLAAQRERFHAVIEPVVGQAGYDLEDLVVSRAGRRHLLRVVVDGDGGVSLDDIADVSRVVSAALDAAEETGGEFVAGEYLLEVSSPGVDRPLTLPRHWRRNIGRLVRVHADDRQVTGRVTDADEERVTLDIDGEARRLAYGRLGPGRVQVEFSRPDGGPDEIDEEELEDEER
ncbi:MAG TPA: ribosome maturation factor RimP [Micromonosporaceae bacterium]|nr:ribosome maturation factor RimP [Micromonosporaceae bacterium]